MNQTHNYYHNILTHYNSIQKLKKDILCLPRFCTFQTSYACNHHCKGCSFGDKINKKMMSEEHHIKVLHDLIAVGVKGFEFCGGGESFTLPYLNKLLLIIIENDCGFGSLTNGSLLTDELINLFVNHGSYIRISMEASNKEDYCKYKSVSESEWFKVLTNISKLTHLKREQNSKLDIGIKFGVSKSLRGIEHFKNAITLAENLGVDNVQFKSLRHEPEELTLADKQEERANLEFIKWKYTIPIIESIVPVEEKEVPQCWLNPLHTVIDYNGDVFLCCYYYFREQEHKIGNMIDTLFTELWFSKKHKDLIKQIDRSKCAMVDCKFFAHHKNVETAFSNNRVEFL